MRALVALETVVSGDLILAGLCCAAGTQEEQGPLYGPVSIVVSVDKLVEADFREATDLGIGSHVLFPLTGIEDRTRSVRARGIAKQWPKPRHFVRSRKAVPEWSS